MDIRSALIVGAGAIGAAAASRIHDVEPGAVALCATGERRERYSRDGLIVNGKRYVFRLADAADAPFDLILIAVKSYNLAEAMEDMRPYVGPGTTILSLLNGITSEEILRAEFGADKVPLAYSIGIDALRVGNRMEFHSIGEIRFGMEKNDPAFPDERVAAVSRFFSAHDLPHSIPADMVKALWFKFMINVALNQWSALLRGSYALFQKSAPAWELAAETMKEVIALSDAYGKGLSSADIDTVFSTLSSLDGRGRSSMLQDVEARRKTEVDIFAGVVIRKSAECGLAAPLNRYLQLGIRAIEDGYSL